MKTFASFLVAPLLLAGLLSGCSSGGGVEGIKTSGDTTATLLTNRPAQQVAVCLADRLHAAVQPDGAGFVIMSAGTEGGAGPVRYRVYSIEDKLARFVTQVEQVGIADSESFVAATCLLGPPPRA